MASSGSGIGVAGLLGVVFVTLKLTGVIDWSWWYVTMPFWLGFAIFFGILAIWLIGGFIGVVISHFLSKMSRKRMLKRRLENANNNRKT